MPREREEAARKVLQDVAGRADDVEWSDADAAREYSESVRKAQDDLRDALSDWRQ